MLVIGEAFDGWRTAKNPYDYSTLIDSCYRDDIHAFFGRLFFDESYTIDFADLFTRLRHKLHANLCLAV